MDLILNLLRTYKWEVLGILLLIGVLFMNRFPDGYIIIGGDILQPIEMVKNFSFLYYDWSGRVSLYYGIFYLLDWFNISETAQLSWYLGLFLFGAYFSFLGFCTLVLPQSSRFVRVIVALFYATNVYTLYVFTATWGFTSYQILYVFIPLLTGLYIRAIMSNSSQHALLFLLISFLTSTSFGNPAFALSLGIYFLFLTSFLFVWIPLKKYVLVKILFMAIGALLLNAYWILPIIPQMSSGIQEINNSQSINLSEALRKKSNIIFDTIRLLPTSEQDKYYPVNFPYPRITWMKQVISFLAFLPFLIILLGYTRKKDNGPSSRLYMTFLFVCIVFIALVAKERFPFATINNFLFHLPGLNTLRGWDKLAIFTPFILSVLIFLSLFFEYGKKNFNILAVVFFAITVLLALPFYTGGIQTNLSYIFSNQKAKDFNTAKQSALVKVPESYYTVTSVFEKDDSDYKLSMLPYSPGSSVGRVSFPEWKVNGPHIARALYGRPFIELTEPYIPGWEFSKEFDTSEVDPQWIINLYGLLGIKYIFYHKDAKQKSMEAFEHSRIYLESIGAIHRVDDNPSFVLYQVDENRLFPYIFVTADEGIFVEPNSKKISREVGRLRESIVSPGYKRQNQKSVTVPVEKLVDGSRIFLNEKYDTLWVAEYISADGVSTILQRDEGVKYANAWEVKDEFLGGNIWIYYSPLKIFFVSRWISGATLFLVVTGTIFSLRRDNFLRKDQL